MTEQAVSFQPDWVSPPGDTIADLLEEKGWTQAEFAQRCGYTTKHVRVRGAEIPGGLAQTASIE